MARRKQVAARNLKRYSIITYLPGPVAAGIVLARHGAGIARPLKPRIGVKTLLIRHKTTPHSKIMNEFVGHLGRILAAEPAQ